MHLSNLKKNIKHTLLAFFDARFFGTEGSCTTTFFFTRAMLPTLANVFTKRSNTLQQKACQYFSIGVEGGDTPIFYDT